MSVDERLRVAFGTTDESWQPDTEVALRDVVRRHRRGVLLRRGAVAGAVAAAVTVGFVFLGGGPLREDSTPDPITPPTSPAPSFGITVLEGRWRTESLDETALRQAMAAAGDGAFADGVLAGLPATPFRLVWEVDRGTAQLRAETGGESTVLDEVALVVEPEAETVTLTPRFADGATVHGFAIDGNDLRLTFVSTTEGVQDSVPGGVWQRLLYDAVAFTRG